MGEFSLSDRDHPISDAPGKLASSYIATGYLRVYGFTVYNSNTASQWILMFDRSSVPADNAVPLMAFNVAGSSVLGVYYGRMGRLFRQGLVLCNSTTDTTKTLGTANCFFDVEYDPLQTLPASLGPNGGQ